MRETVPAALAGERVDRAIALLTGRARSEVADLVAAGAVSIDGALVTVRSRRVAEGEVLEVSLPPATGRVLTADADVAVPVAYVDDDVVVVDKPAGLVVHPGPGHDTATLVHGLLHRYPEIAGVGAEDRPGIVHRLDQGTSGLLAVARTPAAYDALVAQLKTRTADRRYLALVLGHVEAAAGVVDAPVGRSGGDPTRMAVTSGGREARTRYHVRGRFQRPLPVTLLECGLETGRTHQIRVHLAAIGHPVLGDRRYGGAAPDVPLTRPFLHAVRLAFDQPTTGERIDVHSPLPTDLEELHGQLR